MSHLKAFSNLQLRVSSFSSVILLGLLSHHQNNPLNSEMGAGREPSPWEQSGNNLLQPPKGLMSLISLPKLVNKDEGTP